MSKQERVLMNEHLQADVIGEEIKTGLYLY